MFYGNSMVSNKGIEFIKYYKENGFITGFSLGMCSPEVFNDKYSTYTKKVEKINWFYFVILIFLIKNLGELHIKEVIILVKEYYMGNKLMKFKLNMLNNFGKNILIIIKFLN